MKKPRQIKKLKAVDRVIGPQSFAAIAAVEGLRLSAASKKRLAALRTSNLSQAGRRAEVVRAYAKPAARSSKRK
jgi:hypothetical protein